jgi:hypothetical protein
MQTVPRTILWLSYLERSTCVAQAQDSASSPQKLAADQTFALDSGVSVLTVDEAAAQAVANNSLRIVNPWSSAQSTSRTHDTCS